MQQSFLAQRKCHSGVLIRSPVAAPVYSEQSTRLCSSRQLQEIAKLTETTLSLSQGVLLIVRKTYRLHYNDTLPARTKTVEVVGAVAW